MLKKNPETSQAPRAQVDYVSLILADKLKPVQEVITPQLSETAHLVLGYLFQTADLNIIEKKLSQANKEKDVPAIYSLTEQRSQGRENQISFMNNFTQRLVGDSNFSGELEKNLNLISELGIVSPKHVEFFIHQAESRISSIPITQISSLSYGGDYRNLTNVLELAYTSRNRNLNQLGQAFFKRISAAPDYYYGKGEITPNIALSYDLLMAALDSTDPKIFPTVLSAEIKRLSNVSFTNELLKVQKNSVNEIEAVNETLGRDPSSSIGKNYDRFLGMMYTLLYSVRFANHETRQNAMKIRSNLMNRGLQFESIFENIKVDEDSESPTYAILTVKNLQNAISRHLPAIEYKRIHSNLGDDETPKSLLESFAEKISKKPGPERTKEISQLTTLQLLTVGYHNVEQTAELAEESIKQYQKAIRAIFKENVWMVADGGDEFLRINENISESDIKNGVISLRKIGASGITFKPTTPEQRLSCGVEFAYAVEIRLDPTYNENSNKLNLILGDDGQLFDQSGKTITVPEWALYKVKKAIVQRLQYITDGSSEEGSSKTTGAEATDAQEIIRRAHWRNIRSKMISSEVIKHAAIVQNDPRYGVDILKRNLERHIAHPEMDPLDNQTFVMATEGIRKTPYEHHFKPTIKTT